MFEADAWQMEANLSALTRSAGMPCKMLKISELAGDAKSLALKMIALPPSRKRLCSEGATCSASKLMSMTMKENRSIFGPNIFGFASRMLKMLVTDFRSAPFRQTGHKHSVVVNQLK